MVVADRDSNGLAQPHNTSIKWYLQTPRKFAYLRLKEQFGDAITGEELSHWSYVRCHMQGDDKKYPEALVKGWKVLYKGQFVVELKTKKEVEEFIREKLTT